MFQDAGLDHPRLFDLEGKPPAPALGGCRCWKSSNDGRTVSWLAERGGKRLCHSWKGWRSLLTEDSLSLHWLNWVVSNVCREGKYWVFLLIKGKAKVLTRWDIEGWVGRTFVELESQLKGMEIGAKYVFDWNWAFIPLFFSLLSSLPPSFPLFFLSFLPFRFQICAFSVFGETMII